MVTTANIIDEALSILRNHDWYWMMSDSNNAYGYACGSMRTFVELVATINDAVIVKALRDLWTAHYDYVHATMWNSNDEAKALFLDKEVELMSIIKPDYAMAA